MHSLRVEGPDKPGLAARIARLVAHAGINLRGWSAATLGKRSVIYFAFATESDANRAQKALKKGLK